MQMQLPADLTGLEHAIGQMFYRARIFGIQPCELMCMWILEFTAATSKHGVDLGRVCPDWMVYVSTDPACGVIVSPHMRGPLDSLAELYRQRSTEKEKWDAVIDSAKAITGCDVMTQNPLSNFVLCAAVTGMDIFRDEVPPACAANLVYNVFKQAQKLGPNSPSRFFVWLRWAQKVLELLGATPGPFAEFVQRVQPKRFSWALNAILWDETIDPAEKENLNGPLNPSGSPWPILAEITEKFADALFLANAAFRNETIDPAEKEKFQLMFDRMVHYVAAIGPVLKDVVALANAQAEQARLAGKFIAEGLYLELLVAAQGQIKILNDLAPHSRISSHRMRYRNA